MEGAYAVALTSRAKGHLATIQRWWAANRAAAKDLFLQELDACGRRLKISPAKARLYQTKSGRAIRRVLLPRTRYHVYFEVDEARRAVLVLAIWHTSRRRAPGL